LTSSHDAGHTTPEKENDAAPSASNTMSTVSDSDQEVCNIEQEDIANVENTFSSSNALKDNGKQEVTDQVVEFSNTQEANTYDSDHKCEGETPVNPQKAVGVENENMELSLSPNESKLNRASYVCCLFI